MTDTDRIADLERRVADLQAALRAACGSIDALTRRATALERATSPERIAVDLGRAYAARFPAGAR